MPLSGAPWSFPRPAPWLGLHGSPDMPAESEALHIPRVGVTNKRTNKTPVFGSAHPKQPMAATSHKSMFGWALVVSGRWRTSLRELGCVDFESQGCRFESCRAC